MTIKYEIEGSEALQAQIEHLKYYPEIFDKYFYPAMDAAAELVKETVYPRLPVHTGRLQSALGSKVSHGGTSALGTHADIGFGKRYGMPSARYAAALNEGAAPHEEEARRTEDGYLHFSSRGRFTTIGSIRNPGFAGRHFMDEGLEEAKPGIDSLMEIATGRVVEEMATP